VTTLKFNEWQDVGGTPVMRINAGVLEVWDGSAWGLPTPGAAVISSTTGAPDITPGEVIDGVTYDIYEFKGSGSITVGTAGFAELLVIGGGGGGAAGASDCVASADGGGAIPTKSILSF